VIVVGLISTAEGVVLLREVEIGGVIKNWLAPSSTIPGKANLWTWGVEDKAQSEPDLWHFHVVFLANITANVILLWNLNESVLFERNSARIDETFDLSLPRTDQNWRWDWLVTNPNELVLGIENFTVTHYSIRFPHRQNGVLAIVAGISIIIAASSGFVYSRRLETRQKQQNPSRSV
jgi:hypothetical protein